MNSTLKKSNQENVFTYNECENFVKSLNLSMQSFKRKCENQTEIIRSLVSKGYAGGTTVVRLGITARAPGITATADSKLDTFSPLIPGTKTNGACKDNKAGSVACPPNTEVSGIGFVAVNRFLADAELVCAA